MRRCWCRPIPRLNQPIASLGLICKPRASNRLASQGSASSNSLPRFIHSWADRDLFILMHARSASQHSTDPLRSLELLAGKAWSAAEIAAYSQQWSLHLELLIQITQIRAPRNGALELPLQFWVLRLQDAVPREQLLKLSLGIHSAVDLDLPDMGVGRTIALSNPSRCSRCSTCSRATELRDCITRLTPVSSDQATCDSIE